MRIRNIILILCFGAHYTSFGQQSLSSLKTLHPSCTLKHIECNCDNTVNQHQKTENIRLLKELAQFGDGHTYAEPTALTKWYPLRFYHFNDGLYITAADSNHQELVGAAVLSISNIKIDELSAQLSPYISADNHWAKLEKEAILLSNADLLEHLGVGDSSGINLKLKVNGQNISKNIEAITNVHNHFDWMQWGEMYGCADGFINKFSTVERKSQPLHLKYRAPFFYERISGTTNTIYLQWNSIHPFGDISLETFYDSLFKEIEESNIQKLIIDLRYNSGGDGSQILPFVHGIIRNNHLNQPENLFVLTGRKTFSAAVMLVAELHKHTNATFIGEPTGAGYNHYGDAVHYSFNGIGCYVSSLYWQFGHPKDTSKTIHPDIPISFTGSDYFEGKDSFIDAALNGLVSAATAFEKYSLEDAKKHFNELKKLEEEYSWWIPINEKEFNTLGYNLLRKGELHKSLEVFKINTEYHPKSANCWDSYGECLFENGLYNEAMKSYQKSLELNPNNSNASKMIIQITSKL